MSARQNAFTEGNSTAHGEAITNGEHTNDQSVTSLEDDDFELISSVNEMEPSMPRREGPGIPLSDLLILPTPPPAGMVTSAMHQSTASARHRSSNPSTETTISEADNSLGNAAEDGDKTPVMNRRLEFAPNELARAFSTTLLDQSVVCNGHTDNGASVRSFSVVDCSVIDPMSAIESVRADYHAAQDTMREEIDLLKKTCITKKDEVVALRRRLDEATDEKARMVEELNKNEQALKELSLKYDELTAEKMQCDDIIKLQATAMQQHRCNDCVQREFIAAGNGNGSSLSPGILHEQGLMTSLQAKDRQIDELTVELENVRKQYENERAKAIDLEEIVKILHEQNAESDELLRQAQQQFRFRISDLEAKIRGYVERGEVNNV